MKASGLFLIILSIMNFLAPLAGQEFLDIPKLPYMLTTIFCGCVLLTWPFNTP